MKILSKKIAAAIGLLLVIVLELFLIFVAGVSYTDTVASLPDFLEKLAEAPWWVATLALPSFLIIFAIWSLWPYTREIRILRENYRDANKKAFEFSAQFYEYKARIDGQMKRIEKIGENAREVSDFYDRIDEHFRKQDDQLQRMSDNVDRNERALEEFLDRVGGYSSLLIEAKRLEKAEYFFQEIKQKIAAVQISYTELKAEDKNELQRPYERNIDRYNRIIWPLVGGQIKARFPNFADALQEIDQLERSRSRKLTEINQKIVQLEALDQ